MHLPLSRNRLEKYADVLIRYALNSGKGLNKGEVVYCAVPDVAKPLYGALQASILKAGGYPVMNLIATGFDRQFFDLSSLKQVTFFPADYLKARIKLIDHLVGIVAEPDPFELQGVDPDKIIKSLEAKKKWREWQNEKEYAGKFTWTVALWGTPAMAKAAGLSLTEYWDQIIKACYLDMDQPIKKWQEISLEQNRVIKSLNRLSIDQLRVKSQDTDLKLTLGDKRRWVGGSGRNIPSFEIFTSPDWRGTEGTIKFNQPLYRYGNRVEKIQLTFAKGRIVKAAASKNEGLLKAMIKRPNADKLGEFSLTEASFSRITKFMATTLYDENIGGTYGNTHIAVGMSYKDAYDGDPKKLTKRLAKKLGFNDSGEHTDMVSTEDREVTAVLRDGTHRVIYHNGKFEI